MITTQTYRTQTTDLARDLLAAFSALDHGTTEHLGAEEVNAAGRDLLTRLCALTFLHGPDVPARFLADLTVPGSRTPVDITAAWLETGTAPGAGCQPSELQQELVHFSRIVDVGALGLDDGAANHAVRRLRGSLAIPNSLKVLSELLIVARSRMLQRGAALPVPRLRTHRPAEADLGPEATVWVSEEHDFVLLLGSPRRRARRDLGFLFTALLSYLTPTEAAIALWSHTAHTAHTARTAPGSPVELHLITLSPDATHEHVTWTQSDRSDRSGQPTGIDTSPLAWCASILPQIRTWNGDTSARILTSHGNKINVEPSTPRSTCDITTTTGNAFSTVLEPLPVADSDHIPHMLEAAHTLLAAYDGPPVRSIECGHIHLDRQIDIDQEVGALIGAQALIALRERHHAPVLTPMMDDDHVFAKLRPHQYQSFLQTHFPDERMHLIAESSPIIRSIVCYLWERLHSLELQARCRQRGDNILFQLEEGTYIELFEGVSADHATGCIFFELGLLIYRMAPAAFDEYFRTRYNLPDGVHEQAAAILDGPEDHDARVIRLQSFYQQFQDVTRPDHTDAGVRGAVEDVLLSIGEQTHPKIAHLNVLEDYYESQQVKVRRFIQLMQLPIDLVTIHFNAQTGRVVLHTSTGHTEQTDPVDPVEEVHPHA